MEVSDHAVVECQANHRIEIKTENGNCQVESFDEARLVMFMLQANADEPGVPIDG